MNKSILFVLFAVFFIACGNKTQETTFGIFHRTYHTLINL